MLAVKRITEPTKDTGEFQKQLKYAFYIVGGICLLFFLVPGIAGDFIGKSDDQIKQVAAHGFIGGVAAGGVGQDRRAPEVEVIQQIVLAGVGDVHAAHGDGDHVGGVQQQVQLAAPGSLADLVRSGEQSARARLETDLLMGALFWACVLGIASFAAVGFLGRRLTRNWYEEGR